MENQNNTFDPNTFDWEEYDRLSKENIKKLGELEKQIQAERDKEHELVSKMTDEERLEYTKQKYDRINSEIDQNTINVKILEPKKKGD